MHDSFFISLEKSRLCVHRFGNGPRLLIAFHGFKENGGSMAVLETALGSDFTIYAPDLPFNGPGEYHARYFTPGTLEKLIYALTGHFGDDRFSLLGYSLGGRVSLCLTALFIGQLDNLVLLAPDGLKENFWYAFVTRTWIGHGIFRYSTRHPALFHRLFAIGFRLRLINESIYKFVKRHVLLQRDRDAVYRVWTGFKHLRPNLPLIITRIREVNLPVMLFLGRYDRIFPPSYANRLQSIPSLQVRIVENGHQLLTAGVARDIAENLINT